MIGQDFVCGEWVETELKRQRVAAWGNTKLDATQPHQATGHRFKAELWDTNSPDTTFTYLTFTIIDLSRLLLK